MRELLLAHAHAQERGRRHCKAGRRAAAASQYLYKRIFKCSVLVYAAGECKRARFVDLSFEPVAYTRCSIFNDRYKTNNRDGYWSMVDKLLKTMSGGVRSQLYAHRSHMTRRETAIRYNPKRVHETQN